MSLLSTLRTGQSGLSAASTALATTAHNVANASTAGFTRRRVEQATATPIRRDGVPMGAGTEVVRIGRRSDPLAVARQVATSGEAAARSTQADALASVEGAFEPTAGLSLRGAVDGVYDALRSASSDPSASGDRREVVSALQRFAGTVNRLSDVLHGGIEDRDDALAAAASGADRDLAEVASLNQQILATGDQGDLADRRDAAIRRLAESVGARAHFEPDGTATVLVGEHAAVSGSQARDVTVSAGQPPRIHLSVDGSVVDVSDALGGEVGGHLAARADLASWKDDLDALASGFAAALNAANAAGFTGSGPGGDLFVVPASDPAAGLAVSGAVAADPGALAFAGAATAAAGDIDALRGMLALEDAATVGAATAGDAATALTERVGSDVARTRIEAETAAALADDAATLVANLSSVDLDEEAVNLVQFQTAYQAAAKVIQITDGLLETLMSLGR